MKKEKSLNFLSSKWMMVTFLALGILFFSNTSATAQSPITGKIAQFEELRDSFAPATAKYDFVQEAIDYLLILEANSANNPNYLNDLSDVTGQDPLKVDKMLKIRPTILNEYTAAQLAGFASQLANTASDPNSSSPSTQKLQWILDANAY